MAIIKYWCHTSDNAVKWWFATIVVVAIPALVHVQFRGLYVTGPDNGRQFFWIGPIANTLPFLFLAILFLAHCGRPKSKSRRPAYFGAVAAWLGMMAFTISVICLTPYPRLPSTIGLAIMIAPFHYLPFLLLPYAVGTIVGALWNKWARGRSGPDNAHKPLTPAR